MKNHHDSEDWNKSFMHSIHQMHFLIEKHLEQRLTETKNISLAQFIVLLPIRCRAEISQSEIADATNLTEATVSRHVTALTEDGLLNRNEDPDNRRKYLLSLTPKGTQAYLKTKAILESSLEEIFHDIGPRDRKMIITLFDRITSRLLATHSS